MQIQPFSLLAPFADRLAVELLTQEDNVHTDAEIADTLDADAMASLWQVHGNRTIIIREPTSRTEQADGFITDAKHLTLTIRSADCQTFLVYAPKQEVLGLLHVGWRGLIAGAIEQFFTVAKAEWSIDPTDVFVAAGPSLCQACAEFSDPTTELPTVPASFVDGRHVDLRGAADAELFSLGIHPDHVQRSPDCTRCRNETYWSYRGTDRAAVMDGFTNVLAARLL